MKRASPYTLHKKKKIYDDEALQLIYPMPSHKRMLKALLETRFFSDLKYGLNTHFNLDLLRRGGGGGFPSRAKPAAENRAERERKRINARSFSSGVIELRCYRGELAVGG